MNCANCGTTLPFDAESCPTCGVPLPGASKPPDDLAGTASTVMPLRQGTDSSANVPGTKWLTFWTYVGLPAGTVAEFAATLDLPRFRYELVPIALLCAVVGFGLHKRKLWAWQLNWLVVAIIYAALIVPVPMRDPFGSFVGLVTQGGIQLTSIDWTRDSLGDLALPIAIRLVFGGLVWLWPNWRYWTRRQGLFS